MPPHCPQGLLELLRKIYTSYQPSGLKSIEITENGTAWGSSDLDVTSQDEFRMRYLETHLSQVTSAINEGIPVSSYFLWTLIDNFEWAYGYTPPSSFGIVAVEKNSLNRIPKQSYFWYRDLIQRQGRNSQ